MTTANELCEVSCVIKERDDGTGDITITIGPLPPRLLEPLIDALRQPLVSAVLATTNGEMVSGPLPVTKQ